MPLVYSIFRHEMEAILEGKHSTYVQPKKARALKVNKAPEGEPGMAMSYLYQPGELEYTLHGHPLTQMQTAMAFPVCHAHRSWRMRPS